MMKSINAAENASQPASRIPLTPDSSSGMKRIFLLLTVIGTVAPWYWFSQNPSAVLAPSFFFQQVFANPMASTFASDLIISAIAFFAFAGLALKHQGKPLSWLWLYVGLTFGAGVSCALPFFLYRHGAQMLSKEAG